MKHPYYNYTSEDAMKLAQDIINLGESIGAKTTQISAEYALAIIQEVIRQKPHNWITGRVAEETLKLWMGLITEKDL